MYNAGERHEAVRILLDPLAMTRYDPSARQYRRAAALYPAEDLDATG
ncbi:hypothetical protein [Streptomyces lavendulocolor]